MKNIQPKYNIGNEFIKKMDLGYFWEVFNNNKDINKLFKKDIREIFNYKKANFEQFYLLFKENNLIYIFYKIIIDIGCKYQIAANKELDYYNIKGRLYYDINEDELFIYKKNNIIYVKDLENNFIIFNINLNKLIFKNPGYGNNKIIFKNGVFKYYSIDNLSFIYDINKGEIKDEINSFGYLLVRRHNIKSVDIEKIAFYKKKSFRKKLLFKIKYVIDIYLDKYNNKYLKNITSFNNYKLFIFGEYFI